MMIKVDFIHFITKILKTFVLYTIDICKIIVKFAFGVSHIAYIQ